MKGIILIITISVFLSGCETMSNYMAKREQEKQQSRAKFDKMMEQQNADTQRRNAAFDKKTGGYAGEWLTLFKRNREKRASLYKFERKRGGVNAKMVAYTMKSGRYRRTAVQPVEWRTSANKKKIHTRLWDKKKTAYWDVTWLVHSNNMQTGEMTVTQTIDGLKDSKGSKLTLIKCGSSSAKARPYKSLCR